MDQHPNPGSPQPPLDPSRRGQCQRNIELIATLVRELPLEAYLATPPDPTARDVTAEARILFALQTLLKGGK